MTSVDSNVRACVCKFGVFGVPHWFYADDTTKFFFFSHIPSVLLVLTYSQFLSSFFLFLPISPDVILCG